MNKSIRVEVSGKYGKALLLSSLPAVAYWNCNVLTTLLWVGYLTSPPTYRGIDLSTFWAWLRYAGAISTRSSNLRLKPVWSTLDPHQKTLMSDDFGMGFSCHYLAEQHGIEAFVDTGFLLDHLFGVTALRPSSRGPAKTPDFIGIDALHGLHVLECKGTQDSLKALHEAMEKGVQQKNNFTNGGIFKTCMVGGMFVPQHAKKEQALLKYIDPQPDARLRKLGSVPLQDVVQAIYRLSLAKELMAAGLWRTATEVSSRLEESDAVAASADIKSELRAANFIEETSSWQQVRSYRSIERDIEPSLFEQEVDDGVWRTDLSISVDHEVVQFAGEVLDRDRRGARAEANILIAQRAATRRRSRPVVVQEFDAQGQTLPARAVVSPWTSDSSQTEAAVLEGPSGIRFRLLRQREDQ